jgi:hypothetical protein
VGHTCRRLSKTLMCWIAIVRSFTGNNVQDTRSVTSGLQGMLIASFLLCIGCFRLWYMGYDIVNVFICEQPDAWETRFITNQSTWWHPPDDNSLNRLREFKVFKSLHHHTIQINQATRCNNFSSLLVDVYVIRVLTAIWKCNTSNDS